MIDTRLLTTWAAHLDVIVVFIAILRLLSNAQDVKDRSVTCDVPSVEPLANTSITCHFPENVSETRRDVTVSFFKGMDFRDESIILDCWWLSGRMGCHNDPGYSFNRMISDKLTLEIHQVSAKHIGGYRCTLSNINTKDSKICELKIKLVGKTMCVVPSVPLNSPTSLTCYFPENLIQTKADFKVRHYSSGYYEGADTVVSCQWKKDHQFCKTRFGYEFDETVTNHLTVRIPNATENQKGIYSCHFTSDASVLYDNCSLTFVKVAVTSFCNISSVKESQPTSLTCTFNVDVNATKKNFSVVRFGGVDSEGVNILICTWVKDQLNCTTAQGYEFNNTVKNHVVIAVPRASRDHTGKYACHVTGDKIDGFQPCAFILQQEDTYTDVSNIGMLLAIIVIMLIPVSLVIVILVFKFKRRVTGSKAEDMQLISREEDKKLWEPKVGYPPLCPPKTLKEDLLRDEDFTEVDEDARADSELWELEDWYPPLRPPQTLKEDITEDFTEVDKNARAKLDAPRDSFDELVQHLTSHLSSNLHKLRAIFVWMGAQNIGCRQETDSWEDSSSPDYYLQGATNDKILIAKMFAEMCRFARIPCVLVNGKAKVATYELGSEKTKESTWAIVYVADSWRFVYPYKAFVKKSGGRRNKCLLVVEGSGEPSRTRLAKKESTKMSIFDEFYFLTDPEVMNYFCHPNDKEKQLLTEPWTQEKFDELPYFSNSYFSSGWKLISPLTGVIKSTSGWCLIDMFSPGADSKLKYKMMFDEVRSERKFAPEIQQDRYVNIIKRTQQTESILVRLPVAGTYKFTVTGVHGGQTARLVSFQIVCDNAAPDTHPLPSRPENGFGFGEAAAEAGLSEPSHTEGVVPVKSGEEICMRFKIEDGVDINARLVHSTRTSEELLDSVIVKREDDNKMAMVIVKLPADDRAPEYSLEVNTIKNTAEATDESKEPMNICPVLNYLLTSDEVLSAVITDKDKKETLQQHQDAWVSVAKDDTERLKTTLSRVKMAGIVDPILDKKLRAKETWDKRMKEEMVDSAKERNLDRLNRALRYCFTVNLHNKENTEDATKTLMSLCQEEMENPIKRKNLEELRECINKIPLTCVGEMAREQAWFEKGQEVLWDLGVQEAKGVALSLGNKDEATAGQPPNHVNDVIAAAFILIGESEEELDTWQKVNAKLKETNEEQLIDKVNSLDNLSLTRQRVDLAEQKLERAVGTFAEYRLIETLKKQCLKKITFYRTKGSLKMRNQLRAK